MWLITLSSEQGVMWLVLLLDEASVLVSSGMPGWHSNDI